MVPLSWYLIFAALLFSIGIYGVLARANAIGILMALELMLNAANLNFIAFWRYGPHPETATGMVVGMDVRDDCLPLAKTMRIDFKRRAQGAMRAVATLSDAQRQLMQQSDKGEVSVPVLVSDESGEQPIQCEFIWAWIPTPKK